MQKKNFGKNWRGGPQKGEKKNPSGKWAPKCTAEVVRPEKKTSRQLATGERDRPTSKDGSQTKKRALLRNHGRIPNKDRNGKPEGPEKKQPAPGDGKSFVKGLIKKN